MVDDSFEQRGGLGSTRTAIGTHRRRVGDGHRDIELDGGEVVGAVRHAAGATRQERAHGRVRPRIAYEPHPQAGERAIALAPELDVLDLTATVRERLQIFTARRHPHHRSVEHSRRLRDDPVFGVKPGLAAEPSADLRRDDVDVGRWPTQRLRQLVAQRVRHLRRRKYGDATVVGRRGGTAVDFDRCHSHALVHVAAAHDDVGHRIEIDLAGVGDHHRLIRAADRKDDLCSIEQRRFGVDHRGQRFDVGPHRVGGVLGLCRGFREHNREGIAHEPHAIGRQRRAREIVVHLHEAVMRSDVELTRRPHRHHARHLPRLCHVHFDQAAMRDR